MNKEQKELTLKGLKSEDNKVVSDAIKLIREDGDDSFLSAIFSVFDSTDDQQIRQDIYGLFCDIRNQESAKTIVSLINGTDNDDALQMLVSSCWQTRLDYAEYLETFIKLTTVKPFNIAFEAFTVIENIESSFTPERKHELLRFTTGLLTNVSDDNAELAHSIIDVIENYEE